MWYNDLMTIDTKNSATYKEALLRRGYVYRTFMLNSEIYREYKAPNGWTWIYAKNFRNYPFTSISARKISTNKQASYDFASLNGVTIPHTLYTHDLKAANSFLKKYGRVVVKPLNQSGGLGLTVDISTKDRLKKAIKVASSGNTPVLIQEQFIGEELRFTILRGKVESIILRRSPRVVGDGKHSIKELIEIENIDREALYFPLLTYPQLQPINIGIDFMTDDTIPSEGEIIELSKTTMIGKGASFYGVTNDVHKTYIDIAERLGLALNSAMIVVDIMVKDYTKPATSDNYIFLEFNTSPAPQLYSSLRGGDKPAIIDKIVSMIDEYAKQYAPGHA